MQTIFFCCCYQCKFDGGFAQKVFFVSVTKYIYILNNYVYLNRYNIGCSELYISKSEFL